MEIINPLARTACTTAVVVALVAAQPVWAEFEAGQHALDAGNVDEAVAQWQEAANDGDGRAMLELGRLHLQGLGVIQDYVEAHKWFNLAASRGVTEALDARDTLAAKMTPTQVATAQERAAAWQSGGTPDSMQQADKPQPPAQAIREAQALLAALGYDPGQADGVWGGRTIEAYRTFLNDAGLPVGEELTPDALLAMRALAGNRGTGAGAPPTASAPRPAPPLRPDALHQAAQAGDSAGLKAALTAGADVNALDGQGWTALMHAANRGYPQFVDLLLEAKADPDIQAPDGATALFIATVLEQSEVIESLMNAGANISVRGPMGKTPVDAARMRYGDVDTARENKEPSAVLSLLEGKLWIGGMLDMLSIPAGTFRMGNLSTEESTTSNCIAQSEANAFPEVCPVATSDLLCTGEIGLSCWMEVTNQSGCYIWNPNPQRGEKVTWSGCCVDCKAFGKGELLWRYLKDGSRWINQGSEEYLDSGYIVTREIPVHDVTVPAFRLAVCRT